MIKLHFSVLLFLIFTSVLLSHHLTYAEKLGSIAVNIAYTNGDRADYSPISMKIFQDNNQIPYREIDSITGNPFNIVSLPLGHQYKVELYSNGMYSSANYVNLEQAQQDLNVNIPLPGGMRVNVLYNDGQTPIGDAFVIIKSQDNKSWASGFTDARGQTLRFWIEPTTSGNDHYTADVKIGQHLLYSQTPLFLSPGIPQEIYLKTPWPSIVNSLIVLKVYNTQSKLVSSSDGKFVVDLYDLQGNKVMESPVNNRGEADFNNLKVGDYGFRVINLNDNSDWADARFTIDGTQSDFVVQKNQTKVIIPQTQNLLSQIPQIPKIVNCNCVTFRLDNVQDYWLDNAQMGIIDIFKQKDASLTLGIIAKVFGNDSKLVNDIKSLESTNNQLNDIGINGWSFEDFTSFNETGQQSLIEESKNRLLSIVDITPSIFIPPYGKVNQDTFYAMRESRIYYLTGTTYVPPPTYLSDKIRSIPATVFAGYYHLGNGALQLKTNDMIMSQIQASIQNYGFADIALNFQDYALTNGTLKINSLDSSQIDKLKTLIDMIRNNGLRIVKVSEIADQTNVTPDIPLWVKNSADSWSKNKMSNSDFLIGVQYMIKQNLVKAPTLKHDLKVIPSWFTNSAGWWSSGLISNDDFLRGIEFLVNQRIIN